MSQGSKILAKLARDAQNVGLTVTSQTQTAVVISNGSNNLTLSYVDSVFTPSVIGGVDPTNSPYLGMGTNNPGQIQITSSIHTNTNMSDILDSATAAQVFALCASFANDINLSNDNASFTASVRGHSDLRGMGQ